MSDGGGCRDGGRGRRYGRGDVDGAVDWLQELPKDCRGGVAQDGMFAASEHRRHEAAVEAEAAVADGVDAAVDSVETPGFTCLEIALLSKPAS